MKVLRVYHLGRDAAHRARERALAAAGVEVTLVVPSAWPGPDDVTDEPFEVRELPVRRAGDQNRHTWSGDLRAFVEAVAPDLVDIHEEPVSLAARQWMAAAGARPVVMYSAQNLDKRWPPPFSRHERRALRRVQAFYPCSQQAAAVLRGKGFAGRIDVLPLGVDESVFSRGAQELPSSSVRLLLAGRLVEHKGLVAAVRVLHGVAAHCRERGASVHLDVVGRGPDEGRGRESAARLEVADQITWHPWVSAGELAELYRQAHVVLVPSRATATWVEQYGRVITEGWSCGAVPVGYASGSIPEVTGDGGMTVPEGDVEALIAAVCQLVDEPQRWSAHRGCDPPVASSWSTVAAQQRNLYDAALSASPPVASGRRAARAEFGAPARTAVSARPFAAPVLRSNHLLHRVVDTLASGGR